MDETQIETAKASSESLGFHRRRHLRSQTYRTLLRIFSHCYDDSFAAENLDRNVNTDDESNGLGKKAEEQQSQPVESVDGDCLEPKNSVSLTEINPGVDDNGSQDTRVSEEMTIDQIEELMGFEENEDLSGQKDANLGLGPEQMIIDELEDIVKGNDDNVSEHKLKCLSTLLLENQGFANEVGSSNCQRVNAESQQLDMPKAGDASQTLSCSNDVVTCGNAGPRANCADKHSSLNVDAAKQHEVSELNSPSAIGSNSSRDVVIEEGHAQIAPDDLNSSLDENTISNVLESYNNNDDHRSPEANELKVQHQMQLKDSELEIPAITKDIDMEEGEISGGYIMDDISMDMLLQDTEIHEKTTNDKPIDELINNRNELSLETPFDNTNSLVGPKESDRNKAVDTPENVLYEGTPRDRAHMNDSVPEALQAEKKANDRNYNLVVPVNIVEEDVTRHNKSSTEKDAEVRPTKKRGSRTRAKKKERERKNRAEKNRQLGVRRLKLHTIAKPKLKPVNYCRHYLYGRCQEGEKCKFSHDVVPRTKSKPCCHFARHSCMKGDDCPFDHQLSKYPCSNFVSNGFCCRGDGCMFSHKILPNEEALTSSSTIQPETKSATISNTTPLAQQSNKIVSQQTSSALPLPSLLHSLRTKDKSQGDPLLKKPKLMAEGTSSLSVGISPLAEKLKQQISSANGDGDAKAGKSGVVRNSNEILDRTPSGVTPKGINFLSLGGIQRDGSSGNKLASSSLARENGVKQSMFDISNVPNQASSGPSSDSMLKGIRPVVAPKGINFFSFGRVQRDYLSGGRLTSSSANRETGLKLSVTGETNLTTSSAATSDSMGKEIEPVVVSKGINFLSFGKASTDDLSSKGKAKLLTECSTERCVKSQQNALYKPQGASTISLPSPSHVVSPIQSLDNSASKIYKETPYLAQKALFSTLAFAAKYECRTKSTHPTLDPSIGNEIAREPKTNDTIGGAHTNLVKSSKLLEFLSGIASKSKQ